MNRNLNEFSEKELEKELEKRQRAKNKKPKLIENPDLTKVRKNVIEIMNSIEAGEGIGKNDETFLFEDILKAYYGEDVFTYINKNT